MVQKCWGMEMVYGVTDPCRWGQQKQRTKMRDGRCRFNEIRGGVVNSCRQGQQKIEKVHNARATKNAVQSVGL